MAKADNLRLNGVITEVLPNAMFRVKIETGQQITAYLGGKLRQHEIGILAGDNVTVEMSPYDLTRGRVVFRNDRAN